MPVCNATIKLMNIVVDLSTETYPVHFLIVLNPLLIILITFELFKTKVSTILLIRVPWFFIYITLVVFRWAACEILLDWSSPKWGALGK